MAFVRPTPIIPLFRIIRSFAILSIGTDVYTVLEAQGLTVSGGRIDGVGVGGYLLGGGYSYLTDSVSPSIRVRTGPGCYLTLS